jgi:hypothetical protein
MKKIEIEILSYTLTKNFIEIQGNMLNAFGIILFYKMVWWFDGQHWCGVKKTKVQFPLLTYIIRNTFIRMYTLYMCVNV